MSKVVCDVCGTAFAETASQCPICGTAKSEATRSTSGSEKSGGYAYVKGGRFSQANVRKHNSGKGELPRVQDDETQKKQNREDVPRRKRSEDMAKADKDLDEKQEKQEKQEKEEKKERRKNKRKERENEQPSNVGLIIVVVLLLLAIISLCAYIAIRYINMNNEKNNSTGPSVSQSTDNGQLEEVLCTGITIEGIAEHTFVSISEELWLNVVCEPANTTQLLSWNYDATVVKVVQIGNQWCVTPVGMGETVVEVSCGAYSDTISVVCNLSEVPCTGLSIGDITEFTFNSGGDRLRLTVVCEPASTTDPLEWTYDSAVVAVTQEGDTWVITPVGTGITEVTVTCGGYTASVMVTCNVNGSYDPNFVLEWACKDDITLNGYGTRWKIYDGSVDVSEIVFISSDEEIATVENGYVYIWKNGSVTITAIYGDQMITMKVFAKNVEQPQETAYVLSHTDVTIAVGESFTISLRDAETGVKITEGVTFSASEEGFFTVDANGRVTGVASTFGTGKKFYIYVEYEGVTYKCAIYVKNP